MKRKKAITLHPSREGYNGGGMEFGYQKYGGREGDRK
jgi:hypothetical protein